MESKKCKYVDDLTLAKSINLQKDLKKFNENYLVRPLQFHERTEHFLPVENNKMQKDLKEQRIFCNNHKINMNSKKT